MKQAWQLPDIIDLEYFLNLDRRVEQEEGEDALIQRDRALYLKHLKASDAAGPAILLRLWLDAMRKRHAANLLPGRLWDEAYQLASIFALCIGAVMGAGVALSLLVYNGREPVNVSIFLLVLVFSQLFLVGLTIIFLILNSFRNRDKVPHPAISLVSRLFSLLLKWLASKIPVKSLQEFQAAVGNMRMMGQVYGSVYIWPFFLLIQLFGIGFNLGALSATLLRITCVDLAFGWQSTLEFGPYTAYSIVRFLAAPWAWLLPQGAGFPDAAQIEGSRMILKEGIYHLATKDLVSWWPFLCMCMLVYGLLPRIGLFVLGRFMLRRSLRQINFNTARFRPVIRRMTLETLSTSGLTEQETPQAKLHVTDNHGSTDEQTMEQTGADTQKSNNPALYQPALVLVPEDLAEMLERESLERFGLKAGFNVTETDVVDEECQIEKEPCGEEIRSRLQEHSGPVVVVREAWMPPLRETIDFLKQIRRMSRQDNAIIILLAGRPEPDGGLRSATRQDVEQWQRQVAAIGDPGMMVMEFDLT